MLFVQKFNRNLRFYIDFRKLNSFTKKNRYLLLLIEKTLTRILKAKIFTKLNIKQAFYKIRINLDLKKLTTFCTQYKIYKYKVLFEKLTNKLATY